MDPSGVYESSFSSANPTLYTMSEIWPFRGENVDNNSLQMSFLGHTITHNCSNRDGSTVTEHSVGASRKRKSAKLEDIISLNNSDGKRVKTSTSEEDENVDSKVDAETSSGIGNKAAEHPKKDYIHVRARSGQATDRHSLAERARREKISERMKILQGLVPGCNTVIGKALVLDEIINYVQSLQGQVQFLSMKLEAVDPAVYMATERFPSKDVSPFF